MNLRSAFVAFTFLIYFMFMLFSSTTRIPPMPFSEGLISSNLFFDQALSAEAADAVKPILLVGKSKLFWATLFMSFRMFTAIPHTPTSSQDHIAIQELTTTERSITDEAVNSFIQHAHFEISDELRAKIQNSIGFAGENFPEDTGGAILLNHWIILSRKIVKQPDYAGFRFAVWHELSHLLGTSRYGLELNLVPKDALYANSYAVVSILNSGGYPLLRQALEDFGYGSYANTWPLLGAALTVAYEDPTEREEAMLTIIRNSGLSSINFSAESDDQAPSLTTYGYIQGSLAFVIAEGNADEAFHYLALRGRGVSPGEAQKAIVANLRDIHWAPTPKVEELLTFAKGLYKNSNWPHPLPKKSSYRFSPYLYFRHAQPIRSLLSAA